MDLKELAKILEMLNDKNESTGGTFLQVGHCYSFRTVTMIYTGKIKDIRDQEILLEKAAWIADTKRWADYVKDLSAEEIEPYCRDVIIYKGGLLDVFEVEEAYLPREQK